MLERGIVEAQSASSIGRVYLQMAEEKRGPWPQGHLYGEGVHMLMKRPLLLKSSFWKGRKRVRRRVGVEWVNRFGCRL